MPLVSQKVTPPKVYSNAWVAAKKEGGEAETWKVKARAVRSELLDYPLFMTALSMANLLSNRGQQLSMVKCLSNTCVQNRPGGSKRMAIRITQWHSSFCEDANGASEIQSTWETIAWDETRWIKKTALLAGRESEPIACNTSTHFMI